MIMMGKCILRWWTINRVCCVASCYIVSSLLIANGLKEEFEHVKGNKLYDDIDWVCELVEMSKEKYEEN